MPYFETDFTIPGEFTTSGRTMSGSLNGPFPNAEAARQATLDRHPHARLGFTRELD